jgi:TRAP-type C4-dicarboxylate transport system substrate-binding protein
MQRCFRQPPVSIVVFVFALWALTEQLAWADPARGRIAASAPKGSVWDQQWGGYKASFAARPDLFELDYHTYGELGVSEPLLGSVRRGRVQFVATSQSVISTQTPEVAVLSMPYLFESQEEADYVYDCCILDLYQPLAAEQGFVLLQFAEAGWSHFYTTRPIRVPADVNGIRVRAAQSPAVVGFLKQLDADVVFLSISDVVPSLQTGMVDGAYGAITWHVGATRQDAPFFTMTGHVYETGLFLINKEWWDGFPDEPQEMMTTTFEGFEKQRLDVRVNQDGEIQRIIDEGGAVYEPTVSELALWVAAGQRSHGSILDELGGDAKMIYDRIVDAKARYAKD